MKKPTCIGDPDFRTSTDEPKPLPLANPTDFIKRNLVPEMTEDERNLWDCVILNVAAGMSGSIYEKQGRPSRVDNLAEYAAHIADAIIHQRRRLK